MGGGRGEGGADRILKVHLPSHTHTHTHTHTGDEQELYS